MAATASKVPQFCAGFAAAMGAFMCGNALGWASGGMQLIKEAREERPKRPEIDPWITSMLNIGAIASLALTAFIMDRIGRKWTMMLTLPVAAVAWLVFAFVAEDASYIAMRFVSGFATGSYGVACPVYAGEIADKNVRGALGVSYQLFITMGILWSFCMTLTGDFWWFNLVNLIPVAVFAVWMIFMPESPYYLMAKGREEGVRKALRWLRGKDFDIEGEFKEISANVERGKSMKKATCGELTKQKHLRRALWLGLLLMMCQQLSGINAVIFNMKGIFLSASGGKEEEMLDPNYQAIIIAVVQVLATIVSASLVDRFGRRPLMMLSMLVMGISHIGLCIFFIIQEYESEELATSLAWLPLLSLGVYIVAFSLGAGPMPWCMMGEIFSEESKSVSASVASIFNWALSFVVTWVFEFLNDEVPQWVFFVAFAALCGLGLAGLFFYMVETKGRSFEDIQNIMSGNAPDMAPIGFKS